MTPFKNLGITIPNTPKIDAYDSSYPFSPTQRTVWSTGEIFTWPPVAKVNIYPIHLSELVYKQADFGFSWLDCNWTAHQQQITTLDYGFIDATLYVTLRSCYIQCCISRLGDNEKICTMKHAVKKTQNWHTLPSDWRLLTQPTILWWSNFNSSDNSKVSNSFRSAKICNNFSDKSAIVQLVCHLPNVPIDNHSVPCYYRPRNLYLSR